MKYQENGVLLENIKGIIVEQRECNIIKTLVNQKRVKVI